MAGVATDRAVKRADLERKNRDTAFAGVAKVIRRQSWTESVKEAARAYAAELLGIDDHGYVVTVELRDHIVEKIHGWFCGSIIRARYAPKGTPGQTAEWYSGVYDAELAKYEEYLAGLEAARQAA